MTDLDLFAVLDRATDGIDPAASPQHAAVTALARARVVRNRRRGLVAGAVAAVLVLVVAVATDVAGTDRSEPPVMPTPTVPAVPDSAVQATWDPRAAGDLPQRASVLPTEIAPRSGTTRPLPLTGAARLVLADEQERLHLLGEDGTWASTEAPSGSAPSRSTIPSRRRQTPTTPRRSPGWPWSLTARSCSSGRGSRAR